MNVAPFSRQIAAQIADRATRRDMRGTSANAQYVTIHVAEGAHAWRWAKSQFWRLVLVSPPDQDPLDLDWRVVRGHAPIWLHRCGDISSTHFASLIKALLRDGAERVYDPDRSAGSAVYIPRASA